MPLFTGLLISTGKNEERSASSEIHFVLTNRLNIEEDHIRVQDTRISGLITVALDETIDSHEVIRQLIAFETEEPYFMHCLKIRPIDKVIPADVETLIAHLSEGEYERKGSFRITVNKRHTPLRSMDIIKPVAEMFSNDVDLENPDWELLIEIVADKLGFAIIEPELVFSTDLAFQDEDDNIPNWFLD